MNVVWWFCVTTPTTFHQKMIKVDWVKEFYSKQNEWFEVYLGAVEEAHHKRASLIQEMANLTGTARILELGAGGGQTAVAMANLGHEVCMIELLEPSARHAQKLAETTNKGSVEVIHGDFYEVPLEKQFDVVCYFDSFGIGSDDDQQHLLKRVAAWLKPTGCAIIEIGSTAFWAGLANGVEMDLGGGIRRYEFDAVKCRLIDTWWLPQNPEERYHQSLRCYTPVDLELLVAKTNLSIEAMQAGGRVDYEELIFIEKADMYNCMTYYVKLTKKGDL